MAWHINVPAETTKVLAAEAASEICFAALVIVGLVASKFVAVAHGQTTMLFILAQIATVIVVDATKTQANASASRMMYPVSMRMFFMTPPTANNLE